MGARLRAGRELPSSHGPPVKLTIASAHRYPDLARLWYRTVARDVVPAFRRAGAEVSVVLFRDAAPGSFPAAWFEGAILDAPSAACRDFIEFYDAVLRTGADLVLFVDADVFLFDGAWAASHLALFADPALAAVSLLSRTGQPGVFALLARVSAYRALPAPALAPSYEGLADWPNAVNRQPGDRAAIALRAAAGSASRRFPRGTPHRTSPTSTRRPRSARPGRSSARSSAPASTPSSPRSCTSRWARTTTSFSARSTARSTASRSRPDPTASISPAARPPTPCARPSPGSGPGNRSRGSSASSVDRGGALERLAAHEGVRVDVPRVVPAVREISVALRRRGEAAPRPVPRAPAPA